MNYLFESCISLWPYTHTYIHICILYIVKFELVGVSFAQNLKQVVLKMKVILQAESFDRILPGDVSCELTSYSGKISPCAISFLFPSNPPSTL